MLNIKKAITVSSILLNNLVSLSLILALFCLSGNLYAQMPGDFPEGREFDPRHPDVPLRPHVPGEIRPENRDATAISENVELVGATEGAVYDVFVQENYAYVCAGYFLVILDVSAPSNPKKVGSVALPDIASGVYVQGGLAYVADGSSGLRIIDVSSPSSPREVGFFDTPGWAKGVYVQGGLAYVADSLGGLIILRYTGGEPVYYGDVSGNGEITAFDASLILRVVVGILDLNEPEYPYLTLDRADVSGNGTVSALDAALVLQYTVGLIKDFPKSLTGAPSLDAELGSKLLTEAIEKLEAVPLDREGQKVLENLKRLIAKRLPPIHTALLQNFPNPFNPVTWIPYELAQDANVTIRIYNAKGQLIRTFSVGERKAGLYVSKDKATYWDGRDNFGEKVANGVYFYTLQAGDFKATRRMVIMK